MTDHIINHTMVHTIIGLQTRLLIPNIPLSWSIHILHYIGIIGARHYNKGWDSDAYGSVVTLSAVLFARKLVPLI